MRRFHYWQAMPDNKYIDQHLFQPMFSNDDNLSKTGIPTQSFFSLLIPDSQRENIIPIKSFQHLFPGLSL